MGRGICVGSLGGHCHHRNGLVNVKVNLLCVHDDPGDWEWHKVVKYSAMFLWEQGDLGCVGINAVNFWDPLSWKSKVALCCLCSSPTQPSSQGSKFFPKPMVLLMFLWALFLGFVPSGVSSVLWVKPSTFPPCSQCPCRALAVQWVRVKGWCLSQLPKPWNTIVW